MGSPVFRKLKIVILILFILLITPFAGLFIVSKIHHQTFHDELNHLIEKELEGEASFSDLSVRWWQNFPNIGVSLHHLSVPDRDAEAIHIDRADFILNPFDLVSGEVRIKRVIVRGGLLRMLTDSCGNKAAIFTRKKTDTCTKDKSFLVEADQIILKEIDLVVINRIKGNEIYAGIDEAFLKLESTGSMLYFSGELHGSMDSLIANRSKLISNQPFAGRDILFSVNQKTGVKKLERGYMTAHNLLLIPQLKLEPARDGQIITFEISTENTFDSALGILLFHTGLDIQQINPNAVLKASFNQQGLINPWIKPYTEFDFEIAEAEFSGKSLPYPVRVETLKGNYNNGEKHTNETMELVIDTIVAEVEESYVNARLKLINLRDPVINARFVSRIDLEHLPGQNENYRLTGTIEADVKLDGKISELRALHLEGKQQAVGSIKIEDLKLELYDYGHIIGLSSGTTLLNNHMVEVSSLIGSFNQSAFHFQGMFHNLDQFFQNSEEELTGSFTLEFDKLDLRKTIPKATGNNETGMSLPFKNNALSLNIKGNEIITDLGILKNIRVNSTLNDHLLSYRDLHFNILNGTVSGSGEVRLSDTGISNIQSNLGMVFNRLDVDSLVKSLNGEKHTEKKPGLPFMPFGIDVSVNFEAAEMVYKDILVSGAKSDFEITNQTITAQNLQGSLPFGEFSANLGLADFNGENPKINGNIDIKIDSLSFDELLQMDAFSNVYAAADDNTEKKPDIFVPDGNVDLLLMLDADYFSYRKAAITDVDLNMAVVKDKISLNDLQFKFSGGNISLNGFLENDGSGMMPGYLYSDADSVDISLLLDAFDQFGQDKFTSLNSEGIISWASHYYFMLDKNLEPQRKENLMILNFNIHDAIFNEVEPIEKTLFFVGYKSKGHMMVEDLNFSAFLYQDKLYFLNLFMNDNIANLDAYGMVEINDREMDVSLEISLSDLFFRSKKKRILQTRKGIVNLDDDAKIFIELNGPLHDHKLDLISKKKFEERRKELIQDIRNAEGEFKNKNSIIPGA